MPFHEKPEDGRQMSGFAGMVGTRPTQRSHPMVILQNWRVSDGVAA